MSTVTVSERLANEPARPLRVVFLGAANASGGVAGYINAIVDNQPDGAFEFHAICGGADKARWLSERIVLHEFDGTYGLTGFPSRVDELRALLGRIDPDVVHLHTARAGLIGVFGNARLGRPVVYTGHSWRFEQKENSLARWVFRRLERHIAKRSDIVTFLTRRDLEFGVTQGLVDPCKSVAINTRLKDDFEFEVEGGGSGPGSLVLNIGEVCDRKNPLLFIEVARRVLAVRPHARFEWLGEGHLRLEAKAKVSALGLSECISFPGVVAKAGVRLRLQAAHALLFTSRYEGVPLAVIEAKLAGVPVVAARYPGVECVVRDGTDGFVFGLENPAKAAAHVIGLLDDPESRLRFSRAGREFAVDQHSRPAIMAGKFATVYEALAGAYRRRDGSRAVSAGITGDR